MHDYLMHLKALNMQNRTFAIIENGSWAPKSGDLMSEFLDKELKLIDVLNERLSVSSALSNENNAELDVLADAIIKSME